MDELRIFLSDSLLEPWSGFTAGLVAAMFVARLLDFLSTRIVTPRLELEANSLMGWMRWGRTALTIFAKAFQEQGAAGRQNAGPRMTPAEGAKPM